VSRRLWILILAAGTILALSLGFRQSLGLFLTPISADLGIGRGEFALGMGLMNLVWGLASPFAGAVADRHGAGRVAAVGGLCYAAGLAAMTLAGSDGDQLLFGGMLIGLGLSGAGFSVILGTVGRAAPPEKRSLALGIASMGGSIGQFAALPYSHSLIGGVGWSTALIVLAATSLLIVPLAAGVAGTPTQTGDHGNQTLSQALGEALRHRGFLYLNAGFFVCGFQLAFIAIHLPGFLADAGFAPWLATTALVLVGVCNIVGSYACGLLGGWYPKKTVLSLLYVARGLILVAFLVVPVSEVSVLVFGAAMGFLWLGTVPLTSGLVAVLFGTAHLSMLFGIVFLGHQVGGFLGAWLAGYLYDLTGAYDIMWWLSAALALAAAALHWPIAERPVPRLAVAAS